MITWVPIFFRWGQLALKTCAFFLRRSILNNIDTLLSLCHYIPAWWQPKLEGEPEARLPLLPRCFLSVSANSWEEIVAADFARTRRSLWWQFPCERRYTLPVICTCATLLSCTRGKEHLSSLAASANRRSMRRQPLARQSVSAVQQLKRSGNSPDIEHIKTNKRVLVSGMHKKALAKDLFCGLFYISWTEVPGLHC